MFRFQPLALDPACRRRGCVRKTYLKFCVVVCCCVFCVGCTGKDTRLVESPFVAAPRRVERLPECAAAPSSARAREVPGVSRNAPTSCASAPESTKDLVLNAVLKSVSRKT